MIEITCNGCGANLSMDDAFAGGVCRCQHCGTIQTVPLQLKAGAAGKLPASQGGTLPKSKVLYRTSTTVGIAREPVQTKIPVKPPVTEQLPPPAATAAATDGKIGLVIGIIIGILALVLVVTVIVLLIRRPAPSGTPQKTSVMVAPLATRKVTDPVRYSGSGDWDLRPRFL